MNTIDPPDQTTTLDAATSDVTTAKVAPPPARHRLAPRRRQRVIESPAGASAPIEVGRSPLPWARLAVGTLVTALVLGPLLLLAARVGSADWIPGGDRAVIELHVRDVGSHTPLIGPYSRYGWSHPGPLSYWVLAIPYRVLGSTSSALLAGTGILNIVSIAGTLAIAWRRGRLPLLVMTGLAVSILCRSLLANTLVDPWNPFVTVLPLLLFVSLGWTLREGDRWAAPFAVLVGSFLVQSHVGYVGLVGLVLWWSAIGWIRERWWASTPPPGRAPQTRRLLHAARPGAAVAASALVLGLCWAPVFIDQVSGSHNLTQIASYFSSSDEPTAGTAYALGVVTRQITGLPLGEGKTRPPWLGGDEPVDPIGGGEVPVNPIWLGLATALFVVVASAVRRDARHSHDPAVRLRAGGALRLQLLVGMCAATGVVSVARITDVVYNYLILWWPVLAMLVWLATAWALWCLAAPRVGPLLARHPRAGRAARPAAAVGALLLVAWSAQVFLGQVHESATPEEYHRDPVTTLAPATIAATPRGGPVLVESAGGGATNMTDGIRLQLERADRPTVSRSDQAYKFGAERDASKVKPVTEVWVVSGDAIVDWAKRTDVRQVAIWDPLPSTQRARYFQDVEVLRNQILAAHRMDLFDALYSGGSLYPAHGLKGIDQELLGRIDDLRGKGRPIAVFVGPAPAG